MPLPLPLCHDYSHGYLLFPCALEPKVDGIRLTIEVADGRAVALTRGGLSCNLRVAHIVRTLLAVCKRRHLPSVIFDGELQHPDGFNATMSVWNTKPSARDRELVYHVFDCVTDPAEPYSRRRERLHDLLAHVRNRRIRVVQSTIVSDAEQLERVYRMHLADGAEGVVLKDLSSQYGDLGAWYRLKPVPTVSGRVVDTAPIRVRLCRRDGSRLVMPRIRASDRLEVGQSVELAAKRGALVLLRAI